MEPEDAADAVIQWFEPEARGLPWRASRDPYHILLAEFMLQQTQIRTALPRHRRFLERWPTLGALAAANEDDVLAEWSGLGYYRRARNLVASARKIDTDHAGVVPRDVGTLRTLPGVGEYTAAAIASTAYDVQAPAIDGNVLRVAGRFLNLHGSTASAAYRHGVEAWVRAMLDHAPAGSLNQALMDLGSTVCLPRRPKCSECPLAAGCRARAQGVETRIPRRTTKPKPLETYVALLAWRGDRILVEPIHGRGVLEGLWAPPLRRRTPAKGTVLPPIVHTFTHKRWQVTPHLAGRPPGCPRGARWATLEEFSALPASSLGRRLVDIAADHRA